MVSEKQEEFKCLFSTLKLTNIAMTRFAKLVALRKSGC